MADVPLEILHVLNRRQRLIPHLKIWGPLALLIPLGFLAGGERWWLFRDGLLRIEQLTPGVWTLQHWNGVVIPIPAAVITDTQLAHLRAALERGRQPGHIQAVIERGRVIERLQAEQRDDGAA